MLAFNTGALAGNPYVNFVISGVVELPGYFLVLFLVNVVGRKPMLCTALLTAALALLLTIAVPTGKQYFEFDYNMNFNLVYPKRGYKLIHFTFNVSQAYSILLIALIIRH
jgi:hypothetical protein